MDQKRKKALWKELFYVLLIFYLALLIHFTLLGDSMGRNIFNILNWNPESFDQYIRQSVNLVPFTTIRLFIRASQNGTLPFGSIALNLLGNFAVLMPIPLFMRILFRQHHTARKVFAVVLGTSLLIEILQFVFLTGSCDVDDVLLNVSGAMIFYAVLQHMAGREKG